MLGIYRKEYLVRAVLLTAMVWGFALPVVHLVCGMAIEQESVLCDAHATMEGQHASAGHVMHADEYAHEGSATNFEARDERIECCRVDADAVDRSAPLPSLTQVPDLAVSHSDVAKLHNLLEVRAADLAVADDASPPISFRLLFSVFLI